jgi:multicomponent K+:H+ antiporter subunit G
MTEILASALLIIGGAFALIGSIGLARLPDLFMRLHGPTKATTLGIGAIVVASIVHGRTLAPLAISVFLFITAPVVAHVVAKAAGRERDSDRPESQPR